ncbi:uncharacterized protein LOC119737471 isoform X2 [Patiria miniata]|uniref:CCHC-type domain-containing protein n=1 Tax=Patiria miniata TaxID=46514 RepID=A0A914AX07_PATMI|nr:uncharacterized protein LOC119736878 isoform X2 [Patiria miniata]XP_038066819.1 uncharacterized protein LOC119736878 isoform X2 [Patiria miniata]XP_038067790.1 uncharacterized protein LOC119737471 isoform X2 [Patiria miniata]XP_038067791.1 uncharacterized protein LOC119737471 isoform X2 [Patiria miniata]
MSTEEGRSSDTSLIFQKFKDYFDGRFDAISTPKQESSSIRELRNKLEAKELERPGNTEQFEFCGKLEIALDRAKLALVNNPDPDSALEILQEAEELVADRKKKIRIADGSKAGWVTVAKLDKKGSGNLSAEQQKSVKIAEEEALKDLESRKRKRRDSQYHGSDTLHTADRRLFRGLSSYNCFTCGMPGHWSRQCSFQSGPTNAANDGFHQQRSRFRFNPYFTGNVNRNIPVQAPQSYRPFLPSIAATTAEMSKESRGTPSS